MVFSSVPIFINPSNWHQQQNQQNESLGGENPLLPPPPPHVGGGGGTGSIRPGSMTDRARLAKLPQPEAGLKCPRCESTNTKFCYFNNYNHSQPRHFCKACRRYWTRGGALRNVPVGGGCRRNKRTKSRNPKSPVNADTQSGPNLSQPPPQLQFMPSLHNYSHYGAGNLALNFGSGVQPHTSTTEGSSTGVGILSDTAGADQQWRVPQFPLLNGLYPFEGTSIEAPTSYGAGGSQINQEMNLSRQFLNLSAGNDQYWSGGGNAWTDFSGLNSSSTTNLR